MFVGYAHFYSFENLIKFGIIGAASFDIFMFYITGTLCSTFLYLHLICYACYLKFKKINEEIKLTSLKMKLKVSKSTVRLVESIINRHDEACSSLAEFNKF